MLVKQYEFDEMQASQLLMMPYLIVTILLPIVGLLSDRYGRRQSIIIAAGVLQFVMFLLIWKGGKCHRCTLVYALFIT